MNYQKSILPALALSLALAVPGCDSTETREEARAVEEEVAEASRAAGEFLEVRLDALQAEIEEAKREAEQAGEEVSAEWSEGIAKIEREAASIQKDLDRNAERTGDAWSDFADTAQAKMQELEREIKDLTDPHEN